MSDNGSKLDDLPRVMVGDEGFLFLTGGSNSTAALYDDEGFRSRVPLDQWNDCLKARNAFFANLGIPYRLIVTPEKMTVYGDNKILNTVIENPISPGERFYSAVADNSNIIYPAAYLKEQSKNYQVYPKTDSHWSSIGAFSVFQILCNSFGIDVDFSLYSKLEEVHLSYHGDLWDAAYGSSEPETFTRRQVPDSIKEIYVNPVVGLKREMKSEDNAGLHVGSHMIWCNFDAPLKKKIILFGSSFSEYRLECSLFSYLLSLYFQEVHFIWSAHLDLKYIQRHKPDFVVTEMPERFLTQCPADELVIEQYGLSVIQRWRQNNG